MGRCVVSGGRPADAAIDGSPTSAVGALDRQQWLVPCGATDPGDSDLCLASNTAQVITIGGTADQHLQLTVQIRGVVELTAYTGGTQAPGTSWYDGGQLADGIFSDIGLQISSPPHTYHLNYAPEDSDLVAVIQYMASFPIDGGATARLYVNIQDGRQLRNQDLSGTPLRVDGVNVPTPYLGQFAQLDVIAVH
jgi:hypothetical protein